MGLKSIASVNFTIPTVEAQLDYHSGESLRDYDIVVFCPTFPYGHRINFTGGGSCLTIDSASAIIKAMTHWKNEIKEALSKGKTIFVVLDDFKKDLAAIGSEMQKSQRNYSTIEINNYQFLPGNLGFLGAKGRKIYIIDSMLKPLFEIIRDFCEYRIIITSEILRKGFQAKDGSTLGGVVKFGSYTGSIVLLPYFDFEGNDAFADINDATKWSARALKASNALVAQLVAIDKSVRGSTERSPPPDWVSAEKTPADLVRLENTVADLDQQIARIQRERDDVLVKKRAYLDFQHLLYETGKPLERAIESTLHLLGYVAEGVSIGDLEIDHVIVGPNGRRMIGESEGKDTSAIDITKFRQLESNIGEDFEREEVDEPAKGVLFGNGYRFTKPTERPEQFTQKSLTNAKRLGSALVRTMDLYAVAIHLLDNPNDEAFKEACRNAIEGTVGEVVSFPRPESPG